MTEKEVIERLEDLIDTCNKGIEMHPYDKELFKTDKKALQTALQLLEQKDNKINKVIDKLKDVQEDFINYCPDCVDLANDILKILEE